MEIDPDKDAVVKHPNPLMPEDANVVIHTFLGEENGRNEWEEIPAMRVGRFTFIVCCIPFLADDLAPGDLVETDEQFQIRRFLNSTNKYTFRVYFEDTEDMTLQRNILRYCHQFGYEHEVRSKDLIAISAESGTEQRIADYLWDLVQKGYIEYSTGRTL